MNRQDFDYQLPAELIAQHPAQQRSSSRLLQLGRASGEISHRQFTDLLELVQSNDLLVFNDTRVIPARLFGEKDTGGKVEVLIERLTGGTRGMAQIRASKSPKAGAEIRLPEGLALKVVDRIDDMYLIESVGEMSLPMILQAVGHIPLPPYIERGDEQEDRERYQTVYSKREGAVAAPTAGLHFDEVLLEKLASKGAQFAFVTLHVGAGTFQPVRVDDLAEHVMHSEYAEVSSQVCNQVRETKARGGRVIAIGTTAVRCLETASPAPGWIEPYYGDTELFITPGYRFKNVDAMLTNFHLPESTLLMLVSAFAGVDNTKAAYSAAIAEQYRFYSYGDATFIS
ncbi:MAG: tRNA preQ1(34) S-adenosylmethionine ribosyltransferase-isomerase QueA [Pseudomonadales bacterium]|nr:tRNA preQ1(34) S-adenosylmethionine ribosyltransferase-isomerase QueA [Pseudomonadales bacterium]